MRIGWLAELVGALNRIGAAMEAGNELEARARDVPVPGADAVCPECGCADQLPTATLMRTDVGGVSRRVGLAVRCPKCLSEYVSGPHGAYQPPVARREREKARSEAEVEAEVVARAVAEANRNRVVGDGDLRWGEGGRG